MNLTVPSDGDNRTMIDRRSTTLTWFSLKLRALQLPGNVGRVFYSQIVRLRIWNSQSRDAWSGGDGEWRRVGKFFYFLQPDDSSNRTRREETSINGMRVQSFCSKQLACLRARVMLHGGKLWSTSFLNDEYISHNGTNDEAQNSDARAVKRHNFW